MHSPRNLSRYLGLSVVMALVGTLRASALALGARPLRDEAGNVITDNLAWIVFGVVAIVAIGALLKVLGSSVVAWVTTQLGV